MISRELDRVCYGWAYDFCYAYNKVLQSGCPQYEPALKKVLIDSGINPADIDGLIASTIALVGVSTSIPYHELWPVNQFFAAVQIYIYYCLQNKLDDRPELKAEAKRLLEEDNELSRSICNYEKKAAKKIGGAFSRSIFSVFMLYVAKLALYVIRLAPILILLLILFGLFLWSILAGIIGTIIIYLIIGLFYVSSHCDKDPWYRPLYTYRLNSSAKFITYACIWPIIMIVRLLGGRRI